MQLGPYRIFLDRSPREPAVRGVRARRRAGLLASAVAVGAIGLAAPPAFADSSGTANFSLNVLPQVYSVTVSQSVSTFGNCSGGNSTQGQIGFPNGSCDAGTVAVVSGFQPAVTITNTGVAGKIDISGQNAVPADNGTPWTLCTVNVTGPTLCSNSSNPGQDQYALFGAAYNERAGIPNVLDTPSCDQLFDVNANSATGGCTATTGQQGTESLQLQGPSASTDPSSSWTLGVTWTAVPS